MDAPPVESTPIPQTSTPPPPSAPPPVSGATMFPDVTTMQPNSVVLIDGPDGKEMPVTLGQLAERYLQPATPAIDAADLEKFRLFESAVKTGNPEAIQKLTAAYSPAPPQSTIPSTASAPNQELVGLRKELDLLRSQINSAGAVTARIQELEQQAMLGNTVAAHKDKLPHLAAHPDGVKRLWDRLSEYARAAEASGPSYVASLKARQGEILARAMMDVERQIQGEREFYTKFKLPESTKSTPIMVDDQNGQIPPNGAPGSIPAGLTVLPDGTMVDRYGRRMQQTAHRTIEPIPDSIPRVPNTAMPYMQPEPAKTPGPLTESRVRERIKARRAELDGTGVVG